MLKKIFKTQWKGEGVGATVKRAIGIPELQNLDPFLMLDFFKVRLPAGFPDHPHRGFETVTYMISGTVLHEDFKKNAGAINAGDVQWMTAGRGIVHAEMPASKEEDSIGFQLWINLPKEKKMCQPNYQEFKKEEIPKFEEDGMRIVVISGDYEGVKGRISPQSNANFYDVWLEPGKDMELEVPEGWNGLVYPFKGGSLRVNDGVLGVNSAAVFYGNGEVLKIKNQGEEAVSFIVILGEPLNEPVAKYGPFVMSEKEELYQAFEDFQEGKNGFEESKTWKSKIRKLSEDNMEF